MNSFPKFCASKPSAKPSLKHTKSTCTASKITNCHYKFQLRELCRAAINASYFDAFFFVCFSRAAFVIPSECLEFYSNAIIARCWTSIRRKEEKNKLLLSEQAPCSLESLCELWIRM